MHKKFEKNQTKIRGGRESGRKVVTHNSKRYLSLVKPRKLKLQVAVVRFSTVSYKKILSVHVQPLDQHDTGALSS